MFVFNFNESLLQIKYCHGSVCFGNVTSCAAFFFLLNRQTTDATS